MKSQIIALVLLALLVAMSGSAQQANLAVETKGLTPAQVSSLNAVANQLREQPNTLANLDLQTATPSRVKEWTEAGEAAGKAVAAFTKEIGIAADQFLKTDVGRTTFYVAIWKFGGNKVVESLIQVALNVLLGAALLVVWWKFTRRFAFCERKVGSVTYNENTLLRWLGFNKRDVKFEKDEGFVEDLSASEKFWALFVLRVISGVLLVIVISTSWPTIKF